MTGGSGFIGSHLVRQLLLAGHDVRVIDSRPPAVTEAAWEPADILSLDALVAATKGVDVIYHLAAVSNVNVAHAEPLACVDLNLKGTANVLEAARANQTGRVIFASTVWVYNACAGLEGTEQAAFVPGRIGHLYTASKLAGEMLCQSYWDLYKAPYTILRYGIPYGPGMRPELVIAAFIRKALNGEPLSINGDGKQYRKFVYVEDLAEGNVAALAPIAENQTYNLDGAEPVSILDIAQALDRVLGDVEIKFTPARPGDFSGAVTNSLKAERELGWRPRTPFEEGLRRTVAWYMERQVRKTADAVAVPS